MNKHEEGEKRPRFVHVGIENAKAFIENLFPRQRPKGEWEHVYVTSSGRRYVDVKELLEDERVKDIIRKAAEVEVESPSQDAPAERQGQDGGGR